MATLGWIYISLSWGMMIGLRQENLVKKGHSLIDTGSIFPLILIASIWINDTMAYIVGSFIGKTSFSKISPKKTWEGFAGGAALALAFAYGLPYFFEWVGVMSFLTPQYWMIIGAIIIIGGTFGDLVESLLKRSIEIKDSGDSLPGHGGFLDRFDGLLISAPFIVAFLEIF